MPMRSRLRWAGFRRCAGVGDDAAMCTCTQIGEVRDVAGAAAAACIAKGNQKKRFTKSS